MRHSKVCCLLEALIVNVGETKDWKKCHLLPNFKSGEALTDEKVISDGMHCIGGIDNVLFFGTKLTCSLRSIIFQERLGTSSMQFETFARKIADSRLFGEKGLSETEMRAPLADSLSSDSCLISSRKDSL